MVALNRGSVVLFWVPTLKEAVPPPHLREEVWENPCVILKCAERPPPVSEIEEYFNSNDVSWFISMGGKAPRVKSSENLHKKCFF